MNSPTIEERCPMRKSQVWVRRSGSENAVVEPGSGTVHMLNDTAMAIWQLCDGETRPEEMIEAICQLSSLHPDVVTEDVQRILLDFQQVGLIEWVNL